MTKFFVGQRVRIARSDKPANTGREAVILKFGHWPKGSICNNGEILSKDCNVLVKVSGSEHEKSGGSTDQLEPIVPQGAQPCGMSYEEMMQEFKEKVV